MPDTGFDAGLTPASGDTGFTGFTGFGFRL